MERERQDEISRADHRSFGNRKEVARGASKMQEDRMRSPVIETGSYAWEA